MDAPNARHRRWTGRGLRPLVLVAALLTSVSAALPALAGPPLEMERFTDTDTWTECGVYDAEGTVSGMFIVKDARPPTQRQFFEFMVRLQFTDTITNPETGDFFTVSGNVLFKELKPRQIEGTIYRFETIEAGQPFVVRDSSGRTVLRDRGLIRFSAVFDLLGDNEPGGVFLDEELVRVSGPHPGFEETFDFCALADELIGS